MMKKVETKKDDITVILRDIAANRVNILGDHWSSCWCNDAATEIDELRAKFKELDEEIQGMHEGAAGASI